LKNRSDTALGIGEPRLLGIGRVGQKQPDSGIVGECAYTGEVGAATVDRGEVDLEVAGVQDDSLRGVEGDRETVRDRMRDGDELDLEGTDLPALAVFDGDELRPVHQAGLFDAVAGETEGQLGTEDLCREIPQQVGEPAGVVLVTVGEHDGVD
jgi:hypothetical protein